MAGFLASGVGKMAVGKAMQGQQGKGPNPRHQMMMNKYGTGQDMSQYANMGGLLNMLNQMPQNQPKQNQQVQVDEYIRSLLG
jgi:hypothetical protein